MSFSLDSISTQQYTDVARPTPAPTVQLGNRTSGEAIKGKQPNIADKTVSGDANSKDRSGDGASEKLLMDKALQQANQSLAMHNRYVEREIHEVTHAIMYKIKDSNTGEVLFEFPPKKLQDMIAKMWENAGLFIDKEG